MAEDDYESLGAGYSFTTNALAGASAGYFEVTWSFVSMSRFLDQLSISYGLLQFKFSAVKCVVKITKLNSAFGRLPT